MTNVLRWPLFTIDFEASSLAPGSYPIEVGLCRWATPDGPIEGWSTLIRPAPSWQETGSWAAEAQAVHNIRREELDDAPDAAQVLTTLNRIAGPHAAFCDGGEWDFGWSRKLVLAAGFMNSFRLGDFQMLVGRCGADGQARLVRWLSTMPSRHRARDDAERLMQALAQGLELKPGVEPLRIGADPSSATPAEPHEPEANSTSIGMAIERELAEATRLWRINRNDPRIRRIHARVGELSTMRMNLTGP